MVVHYPRTVWKNSYAEHKVTGKTYHNKKGKKNQSPVYLSWNLDLAHDGPVFWEWKAHTLEISNLKTVLAKDCLGWSGVGGSGEGGGLLGIDLKGRHW